jgi:hypothetical protein
VELAATAMRQTKISFSATNAGKFDRLILEMMGDQVHDLTLALDPALDAHHPGAEDDAAVFVINLRPDDEIGTSSRRGFVSSRAVDMIGRIGFLRSSLRHANPTRPRSWMVKLLS